ncbi:MAG TPA: hypothetical protein VIL30_03520 [Ramlibacter sp.]|jgi:hypothetical protein
MRPREVLAENLKTLMSASARLRTIPEIVQACNSAISNGTLDRIRRADASTGIDTLEPLAALFGLDAWQMLVPGLRAEVGPDGLPVVFGLPGWPFEMVDQARYQQLREPAKVYAQAKMMAAIEEREAAPLRSSAREDELARGAVLGAPKRQSTSPIKKKA